MTDEELIARLLDWEEYDEGDINDAREAAADRIKGLKADLRQAKISEVFWRDGWHALDQDKRAVEAKLAKAVEALDKIKRIDNLVGVFAACERTLAELTGGKDDR